MIYGNYVKFCSRQKWFDVVVFYTEPRERPDKSTEGKVIARFTSQTDAHDYARQIQADAENWARWAYGTDAIPSGGHHAEYWDYARIVVR